MFSFTARLILSQIKRLRGIREEYRADLHALSDVKEQTTALQARHDDLKWENEVLTQRFLLLQAERDRLLARFTDAIHEVQKRAGLRLLALDQQLKALDPQQQDPSPEEENGTGALVAGGHDKGSLLGKHPPLSQSLSQADQPERVGGPLNATAGSISSSEDPPP